MEQPNILEPIIRAANAVVNGQIETIDPRVRHLLPEEIRALQQVCIDVSVVLGGLQAQIDGEDPDDEDIYLVCFPGETDFHAVPWYVLDDAVIDAAWAAYHQIFRQEHPGCDLQWEEFTVADTPGAVGFQATTDDGAITARRVACDPQAAPIPVRPLLKSLVLVEFAVAAAGGVSPYADEA
ncbi:MAG: hypothetical protein ACYDCO_20900 [Armatimonadota bacterium]